MRTPIKVKRDYKSNETTEKLLQLVKSEIDNAEDYLDADIRPQIEENVKYYHGQLPAVAKNGASYVDDTVFTNTVHMLANTTEAFGAEDILEVTPDDPADIIAVAITTEVINDTLDRVNNRKDIFEGWFRDALTSKNGIIKVNKDIDKAITTEYFNDVDPELLPEMEISYNIEYDDVQSFITEEETVSVEAVDPVTQTAIQVEQSSVSGYFEFTKHTEVIKIDNIKNENFIIDADATRIENARCTGHKAATTFSDIMSLGFSKDALDELYEHLSNDTDDVTDNAATSSRRSNYGSSNNNVSTDPMMKEVVLYELYLRTAIPINKKNTFKRASLFQVFYAEGVILSCEEVNRAPYVDIVPFGSAHTFWGESYTDKLKHIQRAKTGIMRGYMEMTAGATRPRYAYTQGKVDVRSLMSTVTGSHVGMKDGGMVSKMDTGSMPGGVEQMIARLDQSASDISGVSFQGQGLIADVMKSGGSTVTASMALSQSQMYEKSIIKSFAARGVRPLMHMIYNILREDFAEYKVRFQGQDIVINPSTDLPALQGIRVRTELGASSKLEKAMVLTGFRDGMIMQSTTNPEVAKLFNAEKLLNINTQILELQGIKAVDNFMKTPQELQQDTAMMMQQLQSQMQQMQMQMQTLTQENQQLKVVTSEMAQTELSIRKAELELKQIKSTTDGEIAADKQALSEAKFEFEQEVKANEQALAEAEFRAEVSNPSVSFK